MDEKIKIFSGKLASKQATPTCTKCGQNNYSIIFGRIHPYGTDLIPGIPAAILTCLNCGIVSNFNLKVLGIEDQDETLPKTEK